MKDNNSYESEVKKIYPDARIQEMMLTYVVAGEGIDYKVLGYDMMIPERAWKDAYNKHCVPKPDMTVSSHYSLFKHILDVYGLTLNESQLSDIVNEVNKTVIK